MSKGKKAGKKKVTDKLKADITLYDFANSAPGQIRRKKPTSNVNTVLKELEDEKTWNEKIDLQDDVYEEVSDLEKVKPRHRRKTNSCSSNEKEALSTGNEYPFDVWFLISQQIRPEDIGRFAAICKTSYAVVCSAQFWLSIYRRFYNFQPHLPRCLQPDCMSRLYGLKASVVRALQFTYTPYINRLKKATAFEENLHVLCKRQCVLMWHELHKDQWMYYFKLKKVDKTTQVRETKNRKFDLLEILEDVCANVDENCRILRVTCSDFIPIPSVLGQTLNSVYMTLSSSSCVTQLRLRFGSGIHVCDMHTPDAAVVVLNSVIGVKILDWWHPLYPHDNSLQFLLNRE